MSERSKNPTTTISVDHRIPGVSRENSTGQSYCSLALRDFWSQVSRAMLIVFAACSPAFSVVAFVAAVALPHTRKAAKREEEGVNDARQTFDREQSTMRAEVDRELGKINDLYHERCRDYAQMVTDECEDEVSKNSAGKDPAVASGVALVCLCWGPVQVEGYRGPPAPSRYHCSYSSVSNSFSVINGLAEPSRLHGMYRFVVLSLTYLCYSIICLVPIKSTFGLCHAFFTPGRSAERLGATEENDCAARAERRRGKSPGKH